MTVMGSNLILKFECIVLVLVKVPQRNRTEDICLYVPIDLLWGIGSHDCEAEKSHGLPVFKGEAQESQWCSSSPASKACEPES